MTPGTEKKPSRGLLRVMKMFFATLRPYKWMTFFGLSTMVISEGVSALFVPQILRFLVDSLIPANRIGDGPFYWFWVLVIVYIVFSVTYRISGVLQGIIMVNMVRDLNVYGLAETLKHSYGFFQDEFSGSLMRRITRLSDTFQNIFGYIWDTIVPLLTTLVGVTVIVWIQNPLFGLGLICWFLLFIGVNYGVSQWKMKFDLIRSATDTRKHAVMSDVLANATTVKTFASEKEELSSYHDVATVARDARLKSRYISEVNFGIHYLFTFLIELLVVYFSIRQWQAGLLTVGAFVMYQAYVREINNRVWSVGRLIRDFYEAVADASEMIDIIDMPPGIKDVPRAKTLQVKRGEIAFHQTRFTYHTNQAVLDGFDLTIKPKEKIALVGSSGAGKSTVTKLLFRFYNVDGGSIEIDGQDISRVTQESLRSAIALVPQEPNLFHRSLKENILYGNPRATEKQIIAASKKAHCHEFITSLPKGYDTLVGERGIKLSGGERQRVAIARAILRDAPILVLDEATSSLDSESESLIQDALRQLMKDKTVIVIAHRLSTIMQMDRIIVMEDGKVTDMGTHDELLQKVGIYQKLWNIQAGGFGQ